MTYQKVPLRPALVKKARLLALAGNSTRLRILCFMLKYKKACVSDVAKALDMKIGSISHHLRLMCDNGFFTTERMGNMICYVLVDDSFIKGLKKIIY